MEQTRSDANERPGCDPIARDVPRWQEKNRAEATSPAAVAVADADQDRRLWQYRIERRLAALEARVEQLEADLWCWRRQTRRRRWWWR